MPDIDTDEDDRVRIELGRRKLNYLRIQALAKCSMLPGVHDKAFVKKVLHSNNERVALTDRQETHLVRLCWRYRRQMPRHLVPDINPDDPLSPHFTGFRQVLVAAPSPRDIIHG